MPQGAEESGKFTVNAARILTLAAEVFRQSRECPRLPFVLHRNGFRVLADVILQIPLKSEVGFINDLGGRRSLFRNDDGHGRLNVFYLSYRASSAFKLASP